MSSRSSTRQSQGEDDGDGREMLQPLLSSRSSSDDEPLLEQHRRVSDIHSQLRMSGKISKADELQLEALGHKAELQRNFSPLSMLGLAFAILNSWTALSASLSLALPSGGPTSVLWGLVTAGVCNLCLAASLAELLSAYPTAGGQYHWVAVISWKRWASLLAWITGWINTFGWVALVCSGGLLGSSLVVGVISLENPNYTPEAWHYFLIYCGYNIVAFIVNAFMTATLPYVNKAAITWSIAGFTIISITVLACASPNYSSAEFVFTDFINNTGWPDGIAWLLGLLQGGLGLTGYDAVAHMIEEIPNAAVEGPKIMISCVAIGLFTGFIFLMCLLFVAGNVDDVIESGAGPVLQIFYNATNSHAGAICLLMFPLICLLFATISILTTSSRMTYAFARDGGLPWSRVWAKVHTGLGLPLNALIINMVIVICFGLIYLGSSSALNAIISASVVALGVSYAIPVAISVLQMRRKLPPRAFALPEWLGWFANLLGIAYVIVTTVLFVFPPELPVTGSNMNYCIVAFAIVVMISTFQWFIDGRKNFHGPTMGMGLEVLEASQTHQDPMAQYSGVGKDDFNVYPTHNGKATGGSVKSGVDPRDFDSKDKDIEVTGSTNGNGIAISGDGTHPDDIEPTRRHEGEEPEKQRAYLNYRP